MSHTGDLPACLRGKAVSRGEKRAGDSDNIKIQFKYSIKNTVVFKLGQDVGGGGNKK